MIFSIASFIKSLVIHWVTILSFLNMAGIRWLAKVDPSSPLEPKSTADKSPRWLKNSSKPWFRDTTTKGWAIISEAAEVMTSAGLLLRQSNMADTVDVDVEEAAGASVPQPTRFASLTDRLRASAGVVWDQMCSSPADWCQTCKSLYYLIIGKRKKLGSLQRLHNFQRTIVDSVVMDGLMHQTTFGSRDGQRAF